MGKVKNVVVLGASYAGARAAELLAKSLPASHRVVLVDRQSHFNHLYLFPRLGVVPNHAHKAFIPLTNLLLEAPPTLKTEVDENTSLKPLAGPSRSHVVVHASCTSIGEGFIEVDRDLHDEAFLTSGEDEEGLASRLENVGLAEETPSFPTSRTTSSSRHIPWDYLIYALGCNLPPPLQSPARTKQTGMKFLEAQQKLISKSQSILIAGGGALGIQYATDIADLYNNPENSKHLPSSSSSGQGKKKITLVHSRDRFLPLYQQEVHDEVVRRMDVLGVEVILEERLVMPSAEELLRHEREGGMRTIKTRGGKEIEYDLLLRCTGQKSNSDLLGSFLPQAINNEGFINVLSTTQVALPPDQAPRDNLFAIGDVADAGVIKAGHTGWNQAGIASENILKAIEAEKSGEDLVLTLYEKSPPQIKVTLGLSHSVSELLPMDSKETVVQCHDTAPLDGHWDMVWKRMFADPSNPFA